MILEKMKISQNLIFFWFGLVASTGSLAAWPEKPITLVAPFAAGGNADIMARQIAQSLGTKLGQSVIVENKPGAGSLLGTQYVARSKDGHTFLLGSFANVLNEFFNRNKTFDLRKELIPVTQLVSIPNYFATATDSKIESMADLIAQAKAKPGALTCATSGVGTSSHLACEMLAQRAGIKITIVPYKGGAPAITDVLGGHAHFLALNEVLPYIQDKRMKGLAVTAPKRSPFVPELASASETLPGFDMVSWFGVFAPVGTPPDVVNKINAEIAIALKQPNVLEKFNSLGATPVGSTAKEFTVFVNSEMERWGKIVKPMNIYVD